jgi:hypothetical protein
LVVVAPVILSPAPVHVRTNHKEHSCSAHRVIRKHLPSQEACSHSRAFLLSSLPWVIWFVRIVALLIFVLLYRQIVAAPGINLGIVWIILIGAIMVTFTFGVWKNAVLEQIGSQKKEG